MFVLESFHTYLSPRGGWNVPVHFLDEMLKLFRGLVICCGGIVRFCAVEGFVSVH